MPIPRTDSFFGSASLASTAYGYDHASRLASVSDGNGDSAAYQYLANSPLVGQITFTQSGTTRMTTAKQYDDLNRLTSISSTGGGSSPGPASFNYTYNTANQRVKSALTDGSYWVYGYDALGQVTSGNKYWADGTLVAGQQFDYTFDDIGNRTQTQAGDGQSGVPLRTANYTNNLLNQITSRDAPGYVDIMGLGFSSNAVTVNGLTAYRKGDYFRQQLAVDNTTAPVWQGVTNVSGPASVSGHVYVAQTPQNYTYDRDGNLISDGQWTYQWDGENRLVQMMMINFSGLAPSNQLRLNFAYDYQGRRIQKMVLTNDGTGNYVGAYTNNYVYDGWNLIGEMGPDGSLIRSYLWGTDLSGSLQGAGGVGGLLALTYYGTSTTNCFVAHDGNGNVSALINAADGTTAANYEYGPFGEVIRMTGPMAKLNLVGWSDKIGDPETDLIYYGYRYYNPSTGRWLSKDPIGESGFEIVSQRPKTTGEKPRDEFREVLALIQEIAAPEDSPMLTAKLRSRFVQFGVDVWKPIETENAYNFLHKCKERLQTRL